MKRKTDAQIDYDESIRKEAEAHFNEELAKKTSELEAKAEASKAVGFFEKMSLDRKFDDLLTYVKLYQLKKDKTHRKLGMTWEGFCENIGVARRTIDENLKDLEPIFDKLSGGFAGLCGVPINKIRYLGKNFPADSAGFEDGDIIIDGVKIPLSAENKEEIEAAIDALKESQKRQAEDNEATLKAKDRVLEEKERVIRRQEKDLLKFKREVEARGFEPGEENYIRDMENLKTLLVGFELKMDWRNMPEDATPLMKAAYIETIGHAARVFRAYYDTATDMFGDPEMDDDWIPPHERPENQEPEDDAFSCDGCEYKKALNNPKKGVKIPAGYGKCIRPGGLCEPKLNSFEKGM